ncbi:hypothetical protein Caka_2873 [Coraliomargarita akajimensis DSM 45221]|uniref:Uncharacterized protein n=1 Tax=Coraliomargarita akajimensis (strain DSM 45221 / IAM 15411 / JCM 23193 / KCTC 12865 / 04OKA010-24) TaxID=583355 RepID=D5ER42_CORAD|nr:hypothetical protein Caka_2873 [Coraliomargarita akajimensis DSM 45221]
MRFSQIIDGNPLEQLQRAPHNLRLNRPVPSKDGTLVYGSQVRTGDGAALPIGLP